MAIQSLYPSSRPTLNLHFAKVKALDPRITFVRTTTATYYDGKTVAKAEENLFLQSQNFTTSWTNPGTTDTADTEVAPDGTTTADTITEDLTSGGHSVNQGATFIASTPYTASVFLKAGTNDYAGIVIRTNSSSDYHGVVCDLSTGTITQTNTVDFTSASSSIISVGNGWYRVTITATSASSISGGNVNIYMADSATPASVPNGIPNYTGTGADIYAWGAQLEQRSAVTAYTATTTQQITNYVPVLETATAGEARFDHNPVTGESLGLLVEEQRTNLVLQSEEFDNAYWTKTRSSITANTIVAPDGTLTGDKLVEDTTETNTHQISRSISWTSGTTYTRSLYVKAAERTGFRFQFPSGAFGSAINAYFDLTTGTVTSVGLLGTATITLVGNNWYRCTFSATATATTSASEISCGLTISPGTPTYTGDGFSGIFIWGAQLEAGAFATSYIPTVAATVTRNRDAASMSGTNFSSWYTLPVGTTFLEAVPLAAPVSGSSTDRGIFAYYAGIFGTGHVIRQVNNTISAYSRFASGSVASAGPSLVVTAGQAFKAAAVFSSAERAISFNGGAVGVNSTVLGDFTPTQMLIGIQDTSGSAPRTWNGYIRKISYYPERLTDAELQQLTK